MATYVGTAGTDRFAGTADADIFSFLIANLTAADQVDGSDGTDTLRFVGGGAVAAARFAGVRGVERIELATSSSNLILDDAMVASAAGARVNIFSNGSDKVNGEALLAGHDMDVTAYGGDDWLIGGAGDDAFRFQPRWLTAADRVAGGDGFDSLVISGAGVVSAAALSDVSGIEQLILSFSGTSVTLDDRFMAANAPILSIRATVADATVDASAVTLATSGIDVTAATGDVVFRGGAGFDTFRFDATALTRTDVVAGGEGYDTLAIGAPGVVVYTAFRGVTGMEEIALTQGGTAVQIDDAAVRGNAAVLTIRGSAGNDRVNASSVGAGHAFAFIAGAGDDYFLAGAGDDLFAFDAAQLTGADTIAGGAGTDTLLLTGSGVVVYSALSGVSGIEEVVLAPGGSSLQINQGFVTANGGVTFRGSDANDRINASTVSDAAGALTMVAGAGDDYLLGGAGNDVFVFGAGELTGADTVQGGAGVDTLLFTSNGTIAGGAFARVSGIERIALTDGTNNLTLSGAVPARNGAVLTVVGGSGNDTVDLVQAAGLFTVEAGAGNDTIRLGAGSSTVRFRVADFNSADTVTGLRHAVATTAITTLAFTTAGTVQAASFTNVTNVDRIALGVGGIALTVTNAMIDRNQVSGYSRLTVSGSDGDDLVDATALLRAIPNNAESASNRQLTIEAGLGNDVLLGGMTDEVFRFAASALTAADRVDGGGGFGDVLEITDGGVVDMRGVADVELVRLSGASTLVVPDGYRYRLSITGSRAGDTIDASASAKGIDYVAQGNTGAITGSATDDTFSYSVAQLAGSGALDGGAGSDRLVLTNGGLTQAPDVTGIETIKLGGSAGATNTLVFTADYLTAHADLLLIQTSAGTDTIDLSASTDPTRGFGVILNPQASGVAVHRVTGSAGADGFNLTGSSTNTARSFIDGGDGRDTVVVGPYADLTNVTGVERFLVGFSGGSVALTDALVAGAEGRRVTVDGSGVTSVTIDASAVTDATSALELIGSNRVDIIRGGGGNDRIFGDFPGNSVNPGDQLTGGAGADQFVFTRVPARYAEGGITFIRDFSGAGGEGDRLVYDAAAYKVAGAFDTFAVDTTGRADLSQVDLVRYTARALNDAGAAESYVRNNGTMGDANGLFVVGANSAGETVLYYITEKIDLQYDQFDHSARAQINFGTVTPLSDLSLADFGFL